MAEQGADTVTAAVLDTIDLLSLPLPSAPPPTLESISPASLSLDADQLVDCSPALGLAPQDWVFDDSFISPLISELVFDPTESVDSASGNPSPPGSDSDMSALGLLGPSGRHNIMDPNEYFYQDQSVNSNFPHHHSQDSMSIQNMATTTGSPPSSHLFSLSSAPLSDSLSSNTPAKYRPQGSPLSNHGSGSKKRAAESKPADLEAGDDDAAVKRQRNTMAARKYRQKRLDRISDLERSLGDMTSERDQLKLQLARREAEVEALREMLGKK